MLLKMSQTSQEMTCGESLFNKVAILGPAMLSKETRTQVLSCEICNYFEEHLWMSTCKLYLKRDSNVDILLRLLGLKRF